MKKRFLSRALSAGLLAMAAVGVVPAVAHAATISQCTGQDGVVSRTADFSGSKFVLTHAEVVGLGKGVSYSHSETVDKVASLSATATGSTSVTGGADWKVAKLDATVSYSLAVAGSVTKSTSITETFNIPARSTTQQILFAHGYTQVKGTWKQLTCSRAPGVGTWYDGTVQSYGTVPWTGAFECKHSLYGSSTNFYQASIQAGC